MFSAAFLGLLHSTAAPTIFRAFLPKISVTPSVAITIISLSFSSYRSFSAYSRPKSRGSAPPLTVLPRRRAHIAFRGCYFCECCPPGIPVDHTPVHRRNLIAGAQQHQLVNSRRMSFSSNPARYRSSIAPRRCCFFLACFPLRPSRPTAALNPPVRQLSYGMGVPETFGPLFGSATTAVPLLQKGFSLHHLYSAILPSPMRSFRRSYQVAPAGFFPSPL